VILAGFFCTILCLLPAGQLAVIGQDVYTNGGRAGSYVDNEAPDQAHELEQAHGLRLAGIGPYGSLPRFPGAIRLREFYPVGGLTWRIGTGDGYILQGTFRWAGQRGPTERERRRMWCLAAARHPLVILWYGYSAGVATQVERIMRAPCPEAA
jgi:hypothetical protein